MHFRLFHFLINYPMSQTREINEQMKQTPDVKANKEEPLIKLPFSSRMVKMAILAKDAQRETTALLNTHQLNSKYILTVSFRAVALICINSV